MHEKTYLDSCPWKAWYKHALPFGTVCTCWCGFTILSCAKSQKMTTLSPPYLCSLIQCSAFNNRESKQIISKKPFPDIIKHAEKTVFFKIIKYSKWISDYASINARNVLDDKLPPQYPKAWSKMWQLDGRQSRILFGAHIWSVYSIFTRKTLPSDNRTMQPTKGYVSDI